MNKTAIEWTEYSWNPVTGCTKCSPGCTNCYAERMAHRLRGRCGYPADEPFRVTLHPERINEPLRWKKPRRVFVCSMSDLFHDAIPTQFIDVILEVMMACPQHIFQVLTKRPQNLEAKLFGVTASHSCRALGSGDYLPNLWLGVTAEDQEWWEKRRAAFFAVPAAVHFLSYEPALGPLVLPNDDLARLDWVIAGCESGPRCRHADVAWFRSVRDQVLPTPTAFFLKQMEIGGKIVKMPERRSLDMLKSEWPNER